MPYPIMLFDEYRFFEHKFPDPQYLGAKHTLLAWIRKFLPDNIHTAIDAFSGSQSVAFLFKQLGIKTITNDFLNFNHQIGLALIKNKSTKLTQTDLDILFQPAPNKTDFELMESTFSGVFFEAEEARFLDNFRANVSLIGDPIKQALAIAVINRSITRKITMGHFGHTQALVYANDPERIKRNRSLVRPVKEIFEEILPGYNNAIFDNKQENESFHSNILELLPMDDKVDLAYFDPPYCDSHADYQSFYHLLETFTEYWKDKEFVNTIKRYEPQRISGFDRKRDVISSFNKLFEFAENIPYWLISYNNRSFPGVDEIVELASKHRDVSIEARTYNSSRGGKGSVAGSKEILFICKPKEKYFVALDLQKQLANEEF